MPLLNRRKTLLVVLSLGLVSAFFYWLNVLVVKVDLTNKAILRDGRVVIFPLCVRHGVWWTEETFPAAVESAGADRCEPPRSRPPG